MLYNYQLLTIPNMLPCMVSWYVIVKLHNVYSLYYYDRYLAHLCYYEYNMIELLGIPGRTDNDHIII